MSTRSRKRRIAAAGVLVVLCVPLAFHVEARWHDGRLIDRTPPPADYSFMRRLPVVFPPLSGVIDTPHSAFELDLRHKDLTQVDLRPQIHALLGKADFDSRPTWPPPPRMAPGFVPVTIMELGKNPGLGVRHLHEGGITGRGISVGVVDQSLLRNHFEYRDRIRHYEEIQPLDRFAPQATMHGSAVVSILAGRTVGVAPEADVYYVGASLFQGGLSRLFGQGRQFRWYAQAAERLLEINRTLPAGNRIRVISMQVGWSPKESGYDAITRVVQDAEAQGILVISSSIEDTRGLCFHGLGRPPLADPEDADSYEPGSWWKDDFLADGGRLRREAILVPMDSRTTAAPNGPDDYVFYRTGGWSWSIPYIAGLYALGVQVDPELDPETFWRLAVATGKDITWTDGRGQDHQLGPIVRAIASKSPPGRVS